MSATQINPSNRPSDRCTVASETALLEQICEAMNDSTPLMIQGGNSKTFLGRRTQGNVLDTTAHKGIVNYDPTELVVTARAGTSVIELENTLAEKGQVLAFEPPHYSDNATVGGMVAAGLAGPRRPWCGSVRDFVLGTKVITGHGKLLRFGGEVMKNVAGYDLSRLMAGSFGCLGLITEVSMKVLPKPRHERHLHIQCDQKTALKRLTEWAQQPLPITAACFYQDQLHIRLEGGEASVNNFADSLNGEAIDPTFWHALKELQLPFFADPRPLWRLSLPPECHQPSLAGDCLIDWGGAQRWFKTDADEASIRSLASELGGHATCFTADHTDQPFQPLQPLMMRYHQQLKTQLDPKGIFNPGRMYSDY